MRALALGLFSLMLWLGTHAYAQEAPDVQSIITGQLDAIAHDDAATAYSFAAPSIRERFGGADEFMAMVKLAYPPVYRHRSVQFGKQARDGEEIQQGVVFVDADNDVWTGVYTLGRQSDGGRKITGCVIIRSTDTSL